MATELAVTAIFISALTLLWTIGWSIYTHRRATRASVVVLGAFAFPVYPGGSAGEVSMNVK